MSDKEMDEERLVEALTKHQQAIQNKVVFTEEQIEFLREVIANAHLKWLLCEYTHQDMRDAVDEIVKKFEAKGYVFGHGTMEAPTFEDHMKQEERHYKEQQKELERRDEDGQHTA